MTRETGEFLAATETSMLDPLEDMCVHAPGYVAFALNSELSGSYFNEVWYTRDICFEEFLRIGNNQILNIHINESE